MVRIHWEVEWDEEKAEINLRKHGVSFDAAAEVLQDLEGDHFHFDRHDPSHSTGEDRYITTGSHPEDRRLVLVISWTDRSNDDARVTRIISARKATKTEVKDYGREIGG
jgi:uncharacterized DUF497 family protein